jgi:DNA-binding SARP family transcriptional activator
MKKTFYFLLKTYILTVASTLQANDIEYGLFIKSYPLNDLEKTSLILENNHPLKLSKETSLTFDLFVRPENPFGIILRMITDRNENVDIFITPGEDGNHYLMLVINESIYLMQKSIILEQWTLVSISFSSSKNEFVLSIPESTLSVPYSISQIENIKMSFGLCLFPNFSLYDVSSVNIRNIRIYNNDKLIRYWKLHKHEENLCYDSVANVLAVANNSRWIADDYSRWTRLYSKAVNINSLYTFDSSKELLYIIQDDQKQFIYIYDLKTGAENIIRAKNRHFANLNSSRLLYDNLRDRLVIYNLEEQSTFIFSLKHLTWEHNGKSLLPEDSGYYNHSSVYSASDSLLYSFGGYGYLKYNNALITLNIYNDSITKAYLPGITPRFYSSTFKSDSLLYIFGGRGSKTGRQEIFPQHYIDLYAINLITGETMQLWSMSEPNANFYAGENMIYHEKEKCFYIITDMEDLTLLKVMEDREGYEIMSFFPYDSLSTKAFYRNLFLSADSQKLYALLVRNHSGTQRLIELYALPYPPVPLHLHTDIPQKEKTFRLLLLPVFILPLALFLFLFFRKRNRKKFKFSVSMNLKHKGLIPDLKARFDFKMPGKTKNTHYDFSKQSIGLLGEFSIINKEATNITGQFTPILTDILALLILNQEQGVTTGEFTKLLWYDKSTEAARNNRNVYFSKLRTTLTDIGNIELVKISGFWKIQFGEKVICDYMEALIMLQEVKKLLLNDDAGIEKLLEILNRGPLLPAIEIDWVDKFKRDFSNQVIDVLTDLSQKSASLLSENSKLKIADILFMHDYLNEEALYLKCSVSSRAGKTGIAKNVYENYTREYFDLLHVEYPYTLSDVINRNNVTGF